nr:MAG TPA: hypothetical protein [Caudoviricetes sp.]
MALYKEIIQDDGVATNYHRILYIQSMINSHNSIAVASYINKEGRERENTEKQPYKKAITYEKSYQENMTNEEAYAYLKTLSEFEGAEDV